MDRRDFLTMKSRVTDRSNPMSVVAALDKLSGNLTRTQATHLLRRITFGPTPDLINEITGMTVDEAVNLLLGSADLPMPEPGPILSNWIDEQEENPLAVGSQVIRGEIEGRLRARYAQLIDWWLEIMRVETKPVVEKLTLFWSTVWCIEFAYDTIALMPPPLLYRNNQTLRKNRFGNYKNFAMDITLDGAMLLYQSMYYSRKGAPNENYQRELLELFTMGTHNLITGEENYSEGDIQEGTRALTGWKTAAYKFEDAPNGAFNTYFEPNQHDTDSKTFMQKIIPARDPETENTEFKVKEEEIRDGILKIIFEDRAEAISYFICSKIYRYFVYSSEGDIDWNFVALLAEEFRNNDFELRPVFEALFKSAYFYDDSFIGAQIKTPPDYIIGLEKAFGVKYSNAQKCTVDLEQILYRPPNVGSWKAYRTWVSTTTYPMRKKHGIDFINEIDSIVFIDFGKEFQNFFEADVIVKSITDFFIPVPVSEDRLARFKSVLLDNANVSESQWGSTIDNNSEDAAEGIKALVKEIILSPDFDLS